MSRSRWFDRPFRLGLRPEVFPDILERLHGTAHPLLIRQLEGAWSIQENVGHLLDLEPLWATRLDELLSGPQVLAAADLNNKKTHGATHNAGMLDALLRSFRSSRLHFVARLDGIPASALVRTALHPRLRQPMNITDFSFFVAEHDDHHLGRIIDRLRAQAAV
jgi:uncharacterized damage-inducible protein DinB